MTDKEKPKTFADLLASQPAAQPLDEALENIRARRQRLLGTPAPQPADAMPGPESIPVIDNPDAFAADFWARQQATKKRPRAPKGKPTKAPHLTIHDGQEPPKK